MNTAEWIIVAILSLTLFVFLILGIMVLNRLLDVSNDAKRLMKKLNRIADKGNTIMSDARDTVAGVKSTANSTGKAVKRDVAATTGAIKDAVISTVEERLGNKNAKSSKKFQK